MTAALGTMPFIATLWLLVVLGASVLEESGAKIAAALKGEPNRAPPTIAFRRFSGSVELRQPKPAEQQWRAAA